MSVVYNGVIMFDWLGFPVLLHFHFRCHLGAGQYLPFARTVVRGTRDGSSRFGYETIRVMYANQ